MKTPLPPLKVHIEDTEDLHLISAHFQDALIPVAGLRFEKEERKFHLLANRFR